MLQAHDANKAEVKKLQEALMALGYPLPRWGADGDLGDETQTAFSLFMRDHSATPDTDPKTVSDAELALIYSLLQPVDSGFAPGMLVDRRASAGVAGKKHDGGPRSWAKVTGICLHQTACRLGENPPRWDTVGAHCGVTRQGLGILLHDFDRVIWHGNGWNEQTVGIEIDGLYAGIEGDIKTVWDDPETPYRDQPDVPTASMVEGALKMCHYIINEVKRHGGTIKVIVAHRQSSGNRRDDPGSFIWQHVGLAIKKEFGLDDGGPGFKLNDGYPIPVEWDPAKTGFHY